MHIMRTPLLTGPFSGARGSGARQDAAEDLDGERETVPLVLPGGDQRAGRVGVVLARIGRGLATAVAHDARRHLLARG